MKKKAIYLLLFLLLTLIALLWFFTKAFATLHSAGSLLQIPKQDTIYEGLDSREINGLQLNLPTGASLISLAGDTYDSKINKIDFNNDERDELVFGYKNYGREDSISLSVIYNDDGIWFKALQIDKELLDLNLIKFCDVTGDGKVDLLVGWKETSSKLNGLDIYTWSKNSLDKIYSTAYSKIFIDRQRGDNLFGDRDKLIIWKENGLFYTEDVISWNNSDFVSVSDYFPEDYRALTEFYDGLEETCSNNSEYWYERAYANMSLGDYSKANDYIDKAIGLADHSSDLLRYNIIKGKCQSIISYKKPDETLLNAINDISKSKDIHTKNVLLTNAYYYLGEYYSDTKNYKYAYTYYDLALKCCKAAYEENEEVFKLKVFKISKARTEAAAKATK